MSPTSSALRPYPAGLCGRRSVRAAGQETEEALIRRKNRSRHAACDSSSLYYPTCGRLADRRYNSCRSIPTGSRAAVVAAPILRYVSGQAFFKPDESHAALVAAPILRLYHCDIRFLPGGDGRCGVQMPAGYGTGALDVGLTQGNKDPAPLHFHARKAGSSARLFFFTGLQVLRRGRSRWALPRPV